MSNVTYDHGSREVLVDRPGQTLALTLDEAWGVRDHDGPDYCSDACRDTAAQEWDERAHAARGWVA